MCLHSISTLPAVDAGMTLFSNLRQEGPMILPVCQMPCHFCAYACQALCQRAFCLGLACSGMQCRLPPGAACCCKAAQSQVHLLAWRLPCTPSRRAVTENHNTKLTDWPLRHADKQGSWPVLLEAAAPYARQIIKNASKQG